MTRGYFVIESKGQVLQAAEMSGDSYLQNGYGDLILEAFCNGRAEEYLEKLMNEMTDIQKQQLEDIRPEWYRQTKNVKSSYDMQEYAYVLKGRNLTVYHFGKRLFTVKPETAEKWLTAVRHLDALEDKYLYSDEMLAYDWKHWNSMFAAIQNDLDTLEIPEHEEKILLSDDHCIDVWHRDNRPAYVKELSLPNGRIKFIVSKLFDTWDVYVQLPYIRIGILHNYTSERAAMTDLRKLIHETDVEAFKNFIDMFKLYEELRDKLMSDEISSMEAINAVNAKADYWWLKNSEFSYDKIIRNLCQ